MKKLYYVIIGLIVLLSFRFFSSLFYPVLNSDNAVTILMIHYFKLPKDLYFWGQDRMGSLIPLLGQVPFKLFKLSALTSESITHYLILVLGFFSFAHFLKSYFLKIAFAVIWFFPPMRLVDIIQLYSGVEYSLIAMSCYIFDHYQKERIQKSPFLRHLALSTITIFLIGSIWVSDMALVTVFLLLIVQLYFYLKEEGFAYERLLKKIELYYTVIGFALGYLFIHYAKNLSQNRKDYTEFSDFNTIIETCVIFFNSIWDLLSFNADEPFTSVYTYLVLAICILIISQIKKISLNPDAKKWLTFVLLDTALLFGIIIISNWTFLNGVPRRYFTCTYISLSLGILILLDNLSTSNKHINGISGIVLITVFIGGIGTFYNIKYIWPKTMTPRVEVASEFEKLGKIGIISEYWNSYITACPNPDMIKVIPHEEIWSARNEEMIEEVFKQKNIYVIRDLWLKQFPDTLKQFGRVLVKDGKEFRIGDCDVCKYKNVLP